MKYRGYSRIGWCNPRPGSKIATLRDALMASAITADEMAPLGFPPGKYGSALTRLRNDCGYVVVSWPDYTLFHKNKCKYRFRITGRLDWRGGVAEDYTVPKHEAGAST